MSPKAPDYRQAIACMSKRQPGVTEHRVTRTAGRRCAPAHPGSRRPQLQGAARLRRASLGAVPTGHEPAGFAGGRVVRPPPDRADVAAVDVDSDGGLVADSGYGMNIVVG